MAVSVILVMLVLMTASLHLPVNDSIHEMFVMMTASLHLPVNDSIRDPSDDCHDDGIPSLACE